MACEKQSTVINGHRYVMTMLPATPSYRLFRRLFKIIGPSFGSIMELAKDGTKDIGDTDIASEPVVRGIRVLADAITEDELDNVVEQLKKVTEVGINGSDKTVPLENVFELHFSGAIGFMFKWLYWGLRVQYENFISAFTNLTPQSVGAEPQAESKRTR